MTAHRFARHLQLCGNSKHLNLAVPYLVTYLLK